jgi:Zn-dependent peptidase ImmA (M78 family)/transcriptional regulator with XRE-family HTH domain
MFSPSRLVIARKRRGLTKISLAQAINLTVRSISAFETGSFLPSNDTIASLSEKLRFPVSFFSAPDIEEPSVDGASFRALASMTASQRDMALAAGALAIELNRWINARFQLPTPDVPSLRGFEPEAAAVALRAHWNMGERPIRNVLHLLESHGVHIFSLPRDSDAVNAFSLWHREEPYIFLTTDKSGERGRYDAAHELAHLALHSHGGPRSRASELEADRFASAFLMPQSSVLAVAPRNPNLLSLIQLKKRWSVSLAALVHRLRDLTMITEWQYRSLCFEISQRGYRVQEPEGIPREASQVLAKVFEALRGEGMQRSAIAQEVHIDRTELEGLVFGLVVSVIPGGSTDKRSVNRHGGRVKDLRLLR